MGVIEQLMQAREAYERREWVAAFDGLLDTGDDALSADDFSRLAMAAYLLGRRNDCIQALQRAYATHLGAGDVRAAVRCAFWLVMALTDAGEAAVASGWVARAQRLLDDVDEDVVERGYLLIPVMFRHIYAGEYATALPLAERVEDYGRRFSDPDLLAQGRCARGRMFLYTGRIPEGLALLDEAMVAVSTGEVSAIFAGHIYCAMIEGCQQVSDFARAADWTATLTQWCDDQPGLVPFTGQCAVHRGQIMRVRGALSEALEEYTRAQERYALAGADPAAALAWAERGHVLRILGRFPAAEEAFDHAIALGHDPQPQLALLWLAEGRHEAAAAAVRRQLAEPRDPVQRLQLLPAAVEVLVAVGAHDEASAVAAELGEVADRCGVVALRAAAHLAAGQVAVVRCEYAASVPELRQAAHLYGASRAPYEQARCRVLLGCAFRGLGDQESGDSELAAALAAFTHLGAVPDERQVADLLGATTPPGGLTSREVEVLRLVAAGRSNPEIAAQLVLSEKTVARHLSNIFTKLDVRSRTAAAAFAFEHHLV